jgi:hypothetical protein
MAHSYLKNNFIQNFLPKPVILPTKQQEICKRDDLPEPPQKKLKMSALATFLDGDDDDDDLCDAADDDAEIDVPIATLAVPGSEELDAYLVLPQAHHINKSGVECDILEWWKTHAHMFPNLSKMARQYLGMPASSAGVERLFSAAGRMHSDFRKSAKEETLEMQLIVYQNS